MIQTQESNCKKPRRKFELREHVCVTTPQHYELREGEVIGFEWGEHLPRQETLEHGYDYPITGEEWVYHVLNRETNVHAVVPEEYLAKLGRSQ